MFCAREEVLLGSLQKDVSNEKEGDKRRYRIQVDQSNGSTTLLAEARDRGEAKAFKLYPETMWSLQGLETGKL